MGTKQKFPWFQFFSIRSIEGHFRTQTEIRLIGYKFVSFKWVIYTNKFAFNLPGVSRAALQRPWRHWRARRSSPAPSWSWSTPSGRGSQTGTCTKILLSLYYQWEVLERPHNCQNRCQNIWHLADVFGRSTRIFRTVLTVIWSLYFAIYFGFLCISIVSMKECNE